MVEDPVLAERLKDYNSQAKELVRRLTVSSPSRMTLATGPYFFHYLLERGVCYLTLTEAAFSKRSAFAFLEEVSQQFLASYGHLVETVSRPYALLEFSVNIDLCTRTFTDSRHSGKLQNLNAELQNVQHIMVQNIQDVLQRGEALSTLDDRASNLASLSKKYRQDATTLNLRSTYIKYTIFCIIILLLFTYIYYKFFW